MKHFSAYNLSKLVGILMLIPMLASAQFNYDFNWYNGNGYYLQYPLVDVNLLRFQNNELTISLDTIPLEFNGQNITFSDYSGKLLFYSNGCELRDHKHKLIANSNPLLPGEFDVSYCEPPHAGMVQGQSMLVIPYETNSDTSLYYVYQERDSFRRVNGFDDAVGNFREHKIIDAGGSLQLIYKDSSTTSKNTFNYRGFTTAIKHANNKDWWLVYPLYKDTTHQFESVFITENGATGGENNVQSSYDTPISSRGRSSGQLTVSLDGNSLAMFRRDNEFMTFSFNRITGKVALQTRDTMPWVERWPLTPERGACFSPNGKYLYLGVDSILYQVNMESADFPYDTVRIASSASTNFSLMQLGPDCKIYIMTYPGGDSYHVIHRPNERGKACMAEVKGAKFPTNYQLTMPLFPNYRLGTEEENWCDSIFDDTTSSSYQLQEQQKKWQLWPNPTDEYVKIAHEDGNFGLESVEIYTFQGQMVRERSFEALSITYEMNVSDLPEGMYMLKIQPKVGREEWHKVVVF